MSEPEGAAEALPRGEAERVRLAVAQIEAVWKVDSEGELRAVSEAEQEGGVARPAVMQPPQGQVMGMLLPAGQ